MTSAFQFGAFQQSAWQSSVATVADAFQPNAFQDDAFQTTVYDDAFQRCAFQETGFQTSACRKSVVIGGGWAPEKRRRPKQREFERDQLRELIVQKLEPVAGPAEVVEEPEQVTVRPAAGPAISIPVPPAFDAAEVARMVSLALARGAVRQAPDPVDATAAQDRAAEERAAATVRAELERIRRRRRQDEELLLLM